MVLVTQSKYIWKKKIKHYFVLHAYWELNSKCHNAQCISKFGWTVENIEIALTRGGGWIWASVLFPRHNYHPFAAISKSTVVGCLLAFFYRIHEHNFHRIERHTNKNKYNISPHAFGDNALKKIYRKYMFYA